MRLDYGGWMIVIGCGFFILVNMIGYFEIVFSILFEFLGWYYFMLLGGSWFLLVFELISFFLSEVIDFILSNWRVKYLKLELLF